MQQYDAKFQAFNDWIAPGNVVDNAIVDIAWFEAHLRNLDCQCMVLHQRKIDQSQPFNLQTSTLLDAGSPIHPCIFKCRLCQRGSAGRPAKLDRR